MKVKLLFPQFKCHVWNFPEWCRTSQQKPTEVKFVLGVVGVLCWHDNFLPSTMQWKSRRLTPLLPFFVACETDCGRTGICCLHCSLMLCWCFDLLVVLDDWPLGLGSAAAVDVAVDILVVVLVFLILKVDVGQWHKNESMIYKQCSHS